MALVWTSIESFSNLDWFVTCPIVFHVRALEMSWAQNMIVLCEKPGNLTSTKIAVAKLLSFCLYHVQEGCLLAHYWNLWTLSFDDCHFSINQSHPSTHSLTPPLLWQMWLLRWTSTSKALFPHEFPSTELGESVLLEGGCIGNCRWHLPMVSDMSQVEQVLFIPMTACETGKNEGDTHSHSAVLSTDSPGFPVFSFRCAD